MVIFRRWGKIKEQVQRKDKREKGTGQGKLMQFHGKANGHAGRIGMKTKRVGPRAASGEAVFETNASMADRSAENKIGWSHYR